MRGLALLVPLALCGCEDRLVYDVVVKRGIATVEVRAENIWRDGIDCDTVDSCAGLLESQRKEAVVSITDAGGVVATASYGVRGNELDLVVQYEIPVARMTDDAPFVPVVTQRPSDVRAGRPGVPSLGVIHLDGSTTTVAMKGPALRITGDLMHMPGGEALASVVNVDVPAVVMDVLSRGRGRIEVVVPTVDSAGALEHRATWIQEIPGLRERMLAGGG